MDSIHCAVINGPPQPKGKFFCRMANCTDRLPICRMLNHLRSIHEGKITDVTIQYISCLFLFITKSLYFSLAEYNFCSFREYFLLLALIPCIELAQHRIIGTDNEFAMHYTTHSNANHSVRPSISRSLASSFWLSTWNLTTVKRSSRHGCSMLAAATNAKCLCSNWICELAM